MTPHGRAVFVHGNPETSAVWGPLLGKLGRSDVVCLSPPGFGAPLPDGFSAGMNDYRDWLIARLEAFRDPVDLVGHDWGGAHVLNAVMQRPDLVRSWASDAVGRSTRTTSGTRSPKPGRYPEPANSPSMP
jgi:pimeloyl-ACP methyl ester carboxylesterase